MEHRGSGLVVDSLLITVVSVTRCMAHVAIKHMLTVYAVYVALHTADTYLEYTYQIVHSIQIRPG